MSRFLFVVMWIVAIFVGGPSRPAQAGDGLLLIDVGMVRLNEFGQFAAWEPVSSYTLRNLNTRRVYEFRYFLPASASALKKSKRAIIASTPSTRTCRARYCTSATSRSSGSSPAA